MNQMSPAGDIGTFTDWSVGCYGDNTPAKGKMLGGTKSWEGENILFKNK